MTNLKQKRFVDTDYLHEQLDSITVEVEGSHISTSETKIGYLKDVEILGNTIQDASNLADIRSVGDKVEGQELYEIPVLSNNSSIIVTNIHKDDMCISHTINDFTSSFELMNRGSFDVTVLIHKGGDWQRDVIAKPNKITKIELKDGERVCRIYFYKHHGWDLTKDYNFDSIVQANTKLEEDKLTILSPTPLEKVGDVADRIIEKDGVLGVEKHATTYVITGNEAWNSGSMSQGLYSSWCSDIINNRISANRICYTSVKYTNSTEEYLSSTEPCCLLYTNGVNIKIGATDLTSFKNKIKGMKLTYLAQTPTFIPLPHDQQVKLRTFANKTNISFLTEIEGTIKAQVPKSLGATVNTHTEQIGNLNKELDRVKKLEESTVSTVETGSDFTTVEATSNGYFEDVKLEGKTLVNIVKNTPWNISGTMAHMNVDWSLLKPSTDYTFILCNPPKNTKLSIVYVGENFTNLYNDASKPVLLRTKDILPSGGTQQPHIYSINDNSFDSIELQNTKIVVLEGDHTQNPPSYFEGLKSVGQSGTTLEDRTDEIVVSSVNENLFDGELVIGMIMGSNGNLSESSLDWYSSKNYLRVAPNTDYVVINGTVDAIFEYDDSFKYLGYAFVDSTTKSRTFKTKPNTKYIKLRIMKTRFTDNNIQIQKGLTPTEYTPHQSDKKRLLFYNEETQTWEKPILREWDSIEKHSNGKYYYHQRSGEVVLNGSENWQLPLGENWNNKTLTCAFQIRIDGAKGCSWGSYAPMEFSNKFLNYGDVELYNSDIEGFTTDNLKSNRTFRVLKSKLSTQDVSGFKQWLQANNVTVVYQLAEEKVYECTNIDLITYANETNYIVECGAISPKTTLKVHNNISNVVSLLQKKVSLLEVELYNYKVNQNLRQLRTSYRSDYANFGVATVNSHFVEPTSIEITPYGYDLFEIFKEVIAQGKDKYDRIELEEYIDFYLMTFVFDFDMVFELFDLLDANEDIIEDEPVEEEPPTEEEEDVVEDTPTILPNLPEDEATPIPLI